MRFFSCWTWSAESFLKKMVGWFAGKFKAKNWFSHTLTKDTRGVSNIEENGTDDTATVKKISYANWEGISTRKCFLLLMNLWLYKFLRSINNKELLILFISTSNVVLTSNTFLPNFFIDTCVTDTVVIQFSQQEKHPKLYNYLMKPMNISNYTSEVIITREQLLTYIIHYTLNFSYHWYTVEIAFL